jgi:hypothetical protein
MAWVWFLNAWQSELAQKENQERVHALYLGHEQMSIVPDVWAMDPGCHWPLTLLNVDGLGASSNVCQMLSTSGQVHRTHTSITTTTAGQSLIGPGLILMATMMTKVPGCAQCITAN